MMIKRDIEEYVLKMAKQYPVVAIIGARQTGKTVLSQKLFPDKKYVNFEDPLLRSIFEIDPISFLKKYEEGGIFDEIQNVPVLFSYLQILADKNNKPGQFIITGSQNLLISEKISQSLAGRVSIIELLPFSNSELARSKMSKSTKALSLIYGSYPPVYDKNLDPADWYKNYINAYVQKDIKQILKIRRIKTFIKFLKLCAHNAGQLFNIHRISTETGADKKTIASWLGLLEQTYIIYFLYPYYKNYKKRLIKTPKLYFYDTGVLCSLLNICELNSDSISGELFENWVISEIKKEIVNHNKHSELYFWRDSVGEGIDLIIETGKKLVPVEIKLSSTPKPDFAKFLFKWQDICTDKIEHANIIFGGDEEVQLKNIRYLPWNNISKIIDI